MAGDEAPDPMRKFMFPDWIYDSRNLVAVVSSALTSMICAINTNINLASSAEALAAIRVLVSP